MVSPVVMYGCEIWTIKMLTPKNWCFWTGVLEKTLESPLDCKEIQLVHPKGYQSWTFIGRTDAEAESPVFWPPDQKNWLIWEDPASGKDWRWEQKGMTEDEIVGWHHWLNGKDPDARKDWRHEEKGMTEDEIVGWHHQLDGQVWASSRSWWCAGKPGVLQPTGSQRVGHDWATDLNLSF